MSESMLVHECLCELGKYAYVVRCNSGSVALPNGKRFQAMPAGFTDIMAILPGGKVAFIECKTDKGKPSPKQEVFILKMLMMGARAGIARSVQEALNIAGIDDTSPKMPDTS